MSDEITPLHPPHRDDAAARVLAVVQRLADETHPARRVQPTLDSDLERDLGFDSLTRVELVLRLGREFGCTLPDVAVSQAATPGDLLGYLGQYAPAVRAPAEAPELVGGGAIERPHRAQTLVEVLEHFATRAPQRTHVLLYGDTEHVQVISYRQLLDDALAIAAGLLGRGLQPRQNVALMLPTGREYLASFFGVMLAGGVPVPIYPPVRLSQLEEHLRRHAGILDNAQAVLIITVEQAKPVALLLRAKVPSLIDIFTPEELTAAPIRLLYRASADDLAFLQYTSGSTSEPKGVMLTHANLLANIRAMGQATEARAEDVFVSWLPLYHDMGLIGAWFGSLYHGFPLVLMSPLAFLAQPVRWLRMISQHHGTLSAAPNFAYELCAHKIADEDLVGIDLSSWRLAFNGAEPVSPATLDAFAARFAPYGLKATALTPGYGLAESSVGLALSPPGRGPKIDAIARAPFLKEGVAQPAPPGDEHAIRIPACGPPLPGHDMRVVDAGGVEVPERHVGQLQFRGPSATRGYYRNPVATRGLFSDGWLNTGDYAYMALGEVYLTGRVKDLIIRGGRNIYPYELEQAVGEIAGVRKGCVAVFGSRDERGERLIVLAETHERDAARLDELRRRINEAAVDSVGVPADDIVLVPPHAVLKTPSGKIRRAACCAAYEQGSLVAAVPSRWRLLARLFINAGRARVRFALDRVMQLAYGTYAWVVMIVLGLPVVVLIIALRSPPLGRPLAHVAARLFLALTGLRVKVAGLERLPRRPHVLLVNHASYLDGIILAAVLPPRYTFVAKGEFVNQRAIHAFLGGLGALFVERFDGAKGAEDVEAISDALRQGHNVTIFPEGTFSREAGLKPFRMGAFIAAARSGAPVVAAGLRGVRALLRDGTWRLRYGHAEFEVGAVVMPGGDQWADAAELRDVARSEILRVCGEHDLLR